MIFHRFLRSSLTSLTVERITRLSWPAVRSTTRAAWVAAPSKGLVVSQRRWLETKASNRRPRKLDVSVLLTEPIDPAAKATVESRLERLPKQHQLVQEVESCLAASNEKDAIRLVRLAPPRIEHAKPWNQIIAHVMSQGGLTGGLVLYDYLKTNGPARDVYTLSIVLKGLTRKPVTRWQIDRAVDIFWRDVATHEQWKRNPYVNNAALEVCARGFDLPNALKIYEAIAQEGPGAADIVTYDILFRALRLDVQRHPDNSPAIRKALQDNFRDSDRIWSIVWAKCRSGEIEMNCRVISAYLLVLDLHRDLHQWDTAIALKIVDLVVSIFSLPRSRTNEEKGSPTARRSIFRTPYQSKDPEFARLTPNRWIATVTLGNLAVLDLDVGAGYPSSQSYFEIFTKDFNIWPSSEMRLAYLAALARERESGAALQVMKTWHADLALGGAQLEVPGRQHYKLALLACAGAQGRHRSGRIRGREAVRHAREIIRLLHDPESPQHAYCWTLYLYICLVSQDTTVIYQSLTDLSAHVVGMQRYLESTGAINPRAEDPWGSRPAKARSFATDVEELLRFQAAMLEVFKNNNFSEILRQDLRTEEIHNIDSWHSARTKWLRERGLGNPVPRVDFKSDGATEATKVMRDDVRHDPISVWKSLVMWAATLATRTSAKHHPTV
ncbi:hypothetical protein BDZ85DRAFT_68698 [Elsinoe ampelina]|uniref:Uncharacterized protein n=1 Tax=Elsinoe ampelina TaxID=302913 RepID=A0A6A6GIN8_9PEZI|nr:hypothetical protein BDZ85DRAFT_68698 [Elsinoe ampelina]